MGKVLHIALVQSSLLWENPEQNRIRFSKKLNGLTPEVDMAILPEMFTTGFTMSPDHIDPSEGKKTLDWMKLEAAKNKIALIGSIPFYENGTHTNRLFFVEPDGAFKHYDKRHTFTLAGEDKVYSSGNSKLVVEFKGFKICPMICYDLRFPVWARNIERYDVLVYVANWPKPRIDAWDTLLKARAIENMAYCIGVNRIGTDNSGHDYTGHSAVYDVLGNRMAFAEKEEIIFATLNTEHITITREKLKFLEDGDAFTLLK